MENYPSRHIFITNDEKNEEHSMSSTIFTFRGTLNQAFEIYSQLHVQRRTGRGAPKGAIALLKDEKIESFVVITRNLIPKLLKTYHFLNKTSKIDFLGLQNTVFSKFCPRYDLNFIFSPSLNKFLSAPMTVPPIFLSNSSPP